VKLFAVFDSQGSGRLVGIFDTKEKAERVIRVNPHYYTLHECRLNAVNLSVLCWVQTEMQRNELRKLSSDYET